jgi:hypothetical protein
MAIKLLIGGSPCTHWSIAQKNNRETTAEGVGWELFKNYLIASVPPLPKYRSKEARFDLSPSIYKVWQRMKGCTTNPKHQDFKYYGGRGIIVCEEWLLDFKVFFDWATANGYKPGLTIERSDCDGNYCPDNCTWITIREQQRNKHSQGYLTGGGHCQ